MQLHNPENDRDYDVSFVTVTPEISKAWMEGTNGVTTAGNYRTFKEVGASRYAQDVRDGNWFFTGDTIKVNVGPDGKKFIADGQHRIALPSLTGQPITFLFIEGVFDDEAEDIMDTGMVRSLRDVLYANGYKGPNDSLSYASELASLISAAMRYEVHPQRGVTPTSNKARPSRSEQMAYLRENEEAMEEGVQPCRLVRANTKLLPLPTRAAWAILYDFDPDACREFFERLGLPETRFVAERDGDPIHRLRVKAAAEKGKTGGINDQTFWTKLIVKMFNQWRLGNEVHALGITGRERIFPV